jgi:hypothetical protein
MPVNETPIVVNPANPQQLLAGANDYNCLNLSGFYTSSDGGTSWTRTCVNNPPFVHTEGDPGVGYDLNGNAYISSLAYGNGAGVIFEKSTDNGQTWSAPQNAVTKILGGLVDKDWLQIDTNPTSPYANTVYICATQADSRPDSLISASHSNDGGQTWTTVAVEPAQPYPLHDGSCYMTIRADGTVFMTWLRCTITAAQTSYTGCGGGASTVEFSQSTDGGNTWTTPTAILHTREAPFIKCKSGNFGGFYGVLPNTCDRIGNNFVIAIDNSSGPHRGNLYIAYYEWTGAYLKLFVATSSDGGATWRTTAVAPPTITHDQFCPWVSVNGSGVVGVSWLDRRNDPKNMDYEAFAAFSIDGGASFSPNIKLSDKPSSPFDDGVSQYHFMGDYTGNAWSPDGKKFYVTYTDTSTGVDQDFLAGIQH